jgi:hypothetical protein
MHPRVAKFDYKESGPAVVRQGFEEVKQRASSGPPEGLSAIGLIDLYNPDSGEVLSIAFFQTEEELRQGDETLSAMDPPRSAARGTRISVERYELTVKIDA